MLEKIDKVRGDAMVASLGGTPVDPSLDHILDPGRGQVRTMHDDELAETIGREPNSKLGRLAESEMRSRESWRSPAKWSLIVAGLALLVSFAALFRTF